VIKKWTWCPHSPLICAAFGPQMAADLRKSADRRLRKSVVNSLCLSDSLLQLMRTLLVLLSLQSLRAAEILSITFETMVQRSSTVNINGKS
jgi:hypothetical protein